MLAPILLILGGTFGALVLVVPPRFWSAAHDNLSVAALKAQFPHGKWVYYWFKFLPLVWLPLYAFVVFPGVFVLRGPGLPQLYLVTFSLFGGLGLIQGVFEILTGVIPVRGYPGRFSPGLMKIESLIHDESTRWLGFLHIGLVVLLAVTGVLILSMLEGVNSP